MNPAVKMLQKESNPKMEVLKVLANCSPQQKEQIRGMLPLIQNVAKRAGVPVKEIATFSHELEEKLA